MNIRDRDYRINDFMFGLPHYWVIRVAYPYPDEELIFCNIR